MVAKLLQRPELLTPPRPGQDDKTADGEISGSPHGARPGGEEPTLEKYEERAARWPLTLVKPSSRLGRASKTASPRRACLPVPELKWEKEEAAASSTSRAGRFEACK